jgi:hypothetical protein
MLAAVVAEGVAVALLGLLVAGLLRSHAEILRALHDLGAGLDPDAPSPLPGQTTLALRPAAISAPSGDAAAHDVVGARLDGTAVAVGVAGTRHDTLLAFLSSGCGTCQPFWTAFRQGAQVPGSARLVVVTQSEESESKLRQLAGPDLDVVLSSAAWEQYGVPGSPHFVYVDGPAGRVVGEGTGSSWEQVADLLGQASADRRHRLGRSDAGSVSDPRDNAGRDNAARVDAELASAGIGPGHASLYGPPDAGSTAP